MAWPGFAQTNGAYKSDSSRSAYTSQSLDSIIQNERNPITAADFLPLLSAKDQGIRDLLYDISKKTGIEVVTDEGIYGRISIELVGIDVWDALRIIMDTNQFAYIVEEDQLGKTRIRVVTAQKFENEMGYDFDKNMQARGIELKSIKYSEIENKITSLLSDTGKLYFDEAHKTVYVIDNRQIVDRIEDYIDLKDVPVVTEIIKPKYTTASELYETLSRQFSNVDIKIDDTTQQIIITAVEPEMKRIKSVFKELDESSAKFKLSIQAYQILLNDEHENGVDWEAIVSDYEKALFEGINPKDYETKVNELNMGIVSREDAKILLDALDTVGVIQEISKASIDTSLKKETSISFLPLEKFLDPSNITSRAVRQLDNRIKFGLTLTRGLEHDLALLVRTDVLISLSKGIVISPYDESTRLQRVSNQIGRILPFGSRSDIETDNVSTQEIEGGEVKRLSTAQVPKLDIPPESTLVLGGLYKEVAVAATGKVPLLGDIPIVGFIFRNDGQRIRRSELIVFITIDRIEHVHNE